MRVQTRLFASNPVVRGALLCGDILGIQGDPDEHSLCLLVSKAARERQVAPEAFKKQKMTLEA